MNLKKVLKQAAALMLGAALLTSVTASENLLTQPAVTEAFAAEVSEDDGIIVIGDTGMRLVINEEKTIEYTSLIGRITINGELLTDLPMDPILIDDGYFLVPLREVFEAVGATVEWDNEKRIVTVTNGAAVIRLKPESTSAFVNETELVLGSAPQLVRKEEDINSKVMVPIRFIMEHLGKNVEYDSATTTIVITDLPTEELPPVQTDTPTRPPANSMTAVTYYENSTMKTLLADFGTNVGDYHVFELSEPYRLVVDVYDSDITMTTKTYDIEDSVIKQIRVGEQVGNVARIVVESEQKLYYSIDKTNGDKLLGIRLSESPIPRQTGIVMIDPGHGGVQPGAVGKDSSTGKTYLEKNITIEISKALYEELTKLGIPAYLVRDADQSVDVYDRPEIANIFNASLNISVHCNSYEGAGVARGTETLYWDKEYDNGIDSAFYAQTLQDAMVETYGTRDRGLKPQDGKKMIVIRGAEMPSVIVETAFISHESDLQKLIDPAMQKKVGKALAEAIAEVLEESGITPDMGIVE